MPKLTIITINYNNVYGLEKTITSVISQTYKDFEYIIIDGGSTDGSVNVIKKYENKITFWTSEKDNGIYHAMNKGIKQASGEYCQFLNSGDWLTQNDVIEQMFYDVPDCSILYGNKLTERDGHVHVAKTYEGRQITLLDMYTSTFFHATAYIKRALFDKYGLYDESLKIVSDWKFFLITIGLNSEKVVYRDINLVWFDMNGISSTDHALIKLERAKVIADTIPNSILSDYQQFATSELLIRRFKRKKIIKSLVIKPLWKILQVNVS